MTDPIQTYPQFKHEILCERVDEPNAECGHCGRGVWLDPSRAGTPAVCRECFMAELNADGAEDIARATYKHKRATQ